ncbi:MAG TPA: DNA gyrase inhibitor YacG [Anaeromyxobacteraceae bacterium]|nr:DNA gyrase inhibitor YacG [Anaeromyxobacteraceae bacterium]
MARRRGGCPICGSPVGPRGSAPDWPFCSPRCRLADLGKWLGEAYRVPGERAGDGSGARDEEDEG